MQPCFVPTTTIENRQYLQEEWVQGISILEIVIRVLNATISCFASLFLHMVVIANKFIRCEKTSFALTKQQKTLHAI